MAMQGSYPLNGRTLAGTDTVTGVVTGQTADIPLALLAAFVGVGATPSGPTSSRPIPAFIGQPYFDTTLGFMIWCLQFTPTVLWVDAAGVQV